MTEARWTAKLLNDLRRVRPGAVVVKISDRFTGGIPDFFVGEEGRTTWCEVKLLPGPGRQSKSVLFVPLQVEMCRRLHAWFLFWSVPQKRAYLFRADEMNASKSWLDEEPLSYQELLTKISRIF